MKHWHRHRGTLQVVFDEPPLTIINRHHMVDRLTIATISCQIMDRLLEMGRMPGSHHARRHRAPVSWAQTGRWLWRVEMDRICKYVVYVCWLSCLVFIDLIIWNICYVFSFPFSFSLSLYIYILHRNKSRSCTLSQQPGVHTICFRSHGGQFAAGKETWQGGKKQVMGNLLWHKWDLELSG